MSMEQRLKNEIRKDVDGSFHLLKAVAELVAFGDIDRYPQMLVVSEDDEEATVRAQAFSAIWGIWFNVKADAERKDHEKGV